jgi:hypothetical protein
MVSKRGVFKPFELLVMAVTCRRVINAAPFLYSADPNLDAALACSSFGDCE